MRYLVLLCTIKLQLLLYKLQNIYLDKEQLLTLLPRLSCAVAVELLNYSAWYLLGSGTVLLLCCYIGMFNLSHILPVA